MAKPAEETPSVSKSAEQPAAATSSIFAKLLSVQMELKAPKSLYNSFGKYSYRSAEDVLEAVKPICHAHGLVPFLTDEVVRIGDWNYVKATAAVFDSEDDSKSIIANSFAREEQTKKGMDAAQITGSASSYARKYAMSGLFAIDDNKDPDTRDNSAPTGKVKIGVATPPAVDTVNATPVKTNPVKDLLIDCFAILKDRGYNKTEASQLLTSLAQQQFGIGALAEINHEQVLSLNAKVRAIKPSETN